MEKSNNAAATATVQHVTRSSSDELLRKFAEVEGSLSEDRRQLRLVKRLKRRELALFAAAAGARRRSSSICCGREAANGSGATVVERKSLLSPHFGIGKVRVPARDFKNRSFVATLVKITRSIGDAYLKRQEFALGPEHPRFHLGEALTRPILRSDPTVFKRQLTPDDKFIIFASDGLWEHLMGQRAAEIVHGSPRPGIARGLIRIALSEAATKAGLRYDQIKALGKGQRRVHHDDITVVIVFVDHHDGGGSRVVPGLQIKGSSIRAEPAELTGISLPGGPSTSYGGPSTRYGGESSSSEFDEPALLKATVDFGLGAECEAGAADPKGKAKVEEA